MIVSRVPLIIADILLIYITWTKLRNWGALKDVRQSKRLSLSDVLFRGGMCLMSDVSTSFALYSMPDYARRNYILRVRQV